MSATVLRSMAASEVATLATEVRARRAWLHNWGSDALVNAGGRFAEELLRTRDVADIEGVSYLAYWLRSRNLERLLEGALRGGPAALDGFVEGGGNLVKAQPHGLVCHWVAGNVPTLPLFSWMLALLTKNVSLVRVSQHTIEATDRLLRVFAATPGPIGQLLDTVRFLHFDRDDEGQHLALSSEADCRVIWGGGDVVDRIRAMRQPWHCHDLVFGPKYSIGVIDAATCADVNRLGEIVTAFVRDVIMFEQQACSSPQTIFVEGDRNVGERVMDQFAEEFRRVTRTQPKAWIEPYTAVNIYRTRARYGLGTGRTFRASRGADWTVCLDEDLSLKEAIQSRTVFLTVVPDLMQVPGVLDPRVQTVGMAIESNDRAAAFADAATARGASRCVRPGVMNAYDLPWDGRLVLDDLVRWVSLKR